MNKPIQFATKSCLILILVMVVISACGGSPNSTEDFDDQVQAGVAATLTKEAFAKSVDSARQTEAAKENPTATEEPEPSPTVSNTPSLTPTSEPAHILIPGAPSGRNTYVTDLITVDLAKDKTAVGDDYAWSRLERPYTAEKMQYRDYLDIMRVDLKVKEPWVYITFILIGNLPEEGDIRYAIELDIDHEGRGEFLVMAALPPDTDWTTDGVWVLADEDGDIGGVYPLYYETPAPEQNGYEREIFSNGEGDDRDLAWVRRDPDHKNQIQIAFKDNLIGTLGFLWSAWTDEGLRDPSLFDFNDHYTFEEAGSPNKDNYRYPLKAVALVDSTCRSWYGYVPTGDEPGLCFSEVQLQELSGYGWCLPIATGGCGNNPCLLKCPGKFCIPCRLP